MRWVALLGALVLVLTACGRGDDDGGTATGGGGGDDNGDVQPSPGISDDEIKLGGSYPFSGPASAYGVIGRAVEGYFDYINEEFGGVEMGDGVTRRINFQAYDDAYAPDRAVANARRLVEQDQVFALFNTLGTPNNTAIWDYANAQEVPHVYVATGASSWGEAVAEHPWTTGWQPAYTTESAIYAEYLKQEMPEATVAVLVQNDDYGRDYLNGFKAGIEGSDIEIVAEQTYEVTDPTVDSQVDNLAGSGADVFFNITTPKFAAQAIARIAQTSWEPLHLLNSVSASVGSVLEPAGFDNAQGIITAAYLKDPTDPQWDDDEAMMEYKELIKAHSDVDPNETFGVYGFAVAETLVRALEATQEPTREAFMEAVRSMSDERVDLLLPSITISMDGEEDGYPIESAQLARFEGEQFVLFGDVISYEGETPVG